MVLIPFVFSMCVLFISLSLGVFVIMVSLIKACTYIHLDGLNLKRLYFVTFPLITNKECFSNMAFLFSTGVLYICDIFF